MNGIRAEDADLSASRRHEVIRQGLSVGIATGLYGISFGALSVASGLSVLQTQALSLLLFSGGSQFAIVGIIGAGGSGLAAVATSTLLGIRNGLYGLQVARFLDIRGLRRLAAAQVTIDESTAVGIAQPEVRAQRLGFWVTGATVLVFWNLFTLIGALAGNALGDPATWGLDAAAAGAFCALVWPRLTMGDARSTAALAVFIALVTTPWLPAGIPVIAATLAAVLVGLRSHGRHERPTLPPEPGADPTP